MPDRSLGVALDNDMTNLLITSTPSTLVADIAEAVRRCPSQVDTYLICPGAGTYYYPTQVGAVCRRFPTLTGALEEGIDPVGEVAAAARASGRRVLLSVRLNDVHDAMTEDDWNIPLVRRTRPDLIVSRWGDKRGNTRDFCLDYADEVVRTHMLDLIGEMWSRYDVDGLQLDWMRFPRYLGLRPGESAWAMREVLTGFIAAARALMDSIRPGGVLAVRVPSTPEGCAAIGIDLAGWVTAGVDQVVASAFLTSEPWTPFDALKEIVGGRVPVWGNIEFGHAAQMHTVESLRGTLHGLLDAGADGIQVFNFPCWNEYVPLVPYEWLDLVFDSCDANTRWPMLFSATHAFHRIAEVDPPPALPAEASDDNAVIIELHLAPSALPATAATLLVDSGGAAVAINDHELGAGKPTPAASLFVEWLGGGIFAAHRPPVERCRVFSVPPHSLRGGVNHVRVRGVVGKITLVNLAVE